MGLGPLAVAGIMAGAQLVGGYLQSRSLKKGGQAAYEVAVQNAEDMLELSQNNAAMIGQVANINATAIRNVGYANGKAIEDIAFRNGQLMMIEGKENQRRMLREGRYHVGLVRAMQSSSGWNVNQGTPRIYKEDQKAEIDRERKYQGLKDELSLFTMLTNAGQQAEVTRFAADQEASALLATSGLQRQMMLAESRVRYDAIIREGELGQSSSNRAAQNALYGGALSAVSTGAKAGWFDSWFPAGGTV